MRMRRLKRRKGEPFGKQFEGVHWEKQKVVRKVRWRVGQWEEKFFLYYRDCVYIGLLRAR